MAQTQTGFKEILAERHERMDVFYTDLDQTLIYSYKHEIGTQKRNVEIYQGREVSYMTEKTYRLLQKLQKRLRIVPVTTRTMEQYLRIDSGIGPFRYALVCNGGVLLIDGRPDKAWYEQSLRLAEESREELERAVWYLEREPDRRMEVRDIRRLFAFTKCRHAQDVTGRLQKALHLRKTEIFSNGEKVYVVPKALNKGTAAARFTAYIGAQKTAAAGDSIFDIPMLAQADLAMAPAGCGWPELLSRESVHEMPGKRVFSEELLEFLDAHISG